ELASLTAMATVDHVVLLVWWRCLCQAESQYSNHCSRSQHPAARHHTSDLLQSRAPQVRFCEGFRTGANQSCAIKRRGFVIRLVGYDLRDREGWWRARPNSPPNRR